MPSYLLSHLFLFLLLTGVLRTAAQDTTPYKLSAAIEKEAQSGKPGANQYAAWDYSYIGEYQKALKAYDGTRRSTKTIAPADSLTFAGLKPVDAHQYIVSRARTERIIILNEAHHNPRHRVFTASLLRDLAQLGFRYLAVEAVDKVDSLLNQRQYPVLKTGFYTKEPQFGNFLRAASQYGFQVVPYDHGFSNEGEMDAQILARETAQARNIQQILRIDPKAKIIVHCGFSHANEGPNGMGNQTAMAGHLKALTGIDPFTIDQIALSEAGTTDGEYALYRLAKAPHSAVFLDAEKMPYAGANRSMSVDVNVYHPRTTYRAGRPEWVFSNGRQPVAVVKPAAVGYPCLVLAYAAAEDMTRAVPIDVVELQSPQDRPALALPKGRYTVVAKDQAGNTRTWTVKK